MKIIEKTITSKRNTEIPVTIVESEKTEKLLLCIHGFKANRTEDGRFLTVAKALSEKGVTSIMPGFPGCDVSKEDFINYSIRNCISDIDTCYDYMKENYQFDENFYSLINIFFSFHMYSFTFSLYISEN